MFYQVTRHSDEEITAFLQTKAEQGLSLKKVSGNNFLFEKKPYDGRQVCALTLYAHGHDTSTELQVREELVFLRKQGWDSVCVGKQETLNDSRRHVYLIEEIKGSEIPKADNRSETRALIRGKFKTISNLLMTLLFVSVAVFMLRGSLINIVSSNAYIVFTCFMLLFLAFLTVLCTGAFLQKFFKLFKKELLDVSTLLVFVFLILFAAFLFFDDLLTDKGVSERIKIGASSYRLYSDEIPVSLEDLGADTSGSYRTSRKTESSSFLASYLYCFDESFGILEGESVYDESTSEDVSFVRYQLFVSENEALRNIVVNQLLKGTAKYSKSLCNASECDYAFETSDSFLLGKGNAVIFVKCGFELTEAGLKKLGQLL